MRALHPTPGSAATPSRAHGLSPLLLEWLDGEPLAGRALLDVGTGTGRLALALASRARRVVGIDTDPAALAAARRRARQLRYGNLRFVAADAEQADYRALATPDVVVAHLCLSDAIVRRAAAGLPAGGIFAFAAFGAEQWRETGRRSRFAYTADGARSVLEDAGFQVERLDVETQVRHFDTVEDALAATAELRPRWEADGRWSGWTRFLAAGGRTLTQSRVVAWARLGGAATGW
jgi:SAM-dependent methyltransferase